MVVFVTFQDGKCHFEVGTVIGAEISSYVNVTSGNSTALKAALVHYGPVAVNIDASHETFSFYSSGVYFDPNCSELRCQLIIKHINSCIFFKHLENGYADLDHAVLAVGYGTLYGEDYWLIKNSWSNHWGDSGYVLMSMKDNNCGVTTNPTYVNIKEV